MWKPIGPRRRGTNVYQRLRTHPARQGQDGIGETGKIARRAGRYGRQSTQKADRPDDAAKAEEQRKDMQRALQAGVDLAPKVEKLSNEAAAELEAAQPAKALPPQEEALKLLKEMLPEGRAEKGPGQRERSE